MPTEANEGNEEAGFETTLRRNGIGMEARWREAFARSLIVGWTECTKQQDRRTATKSREEAQNETNATALTDEEWQKFLPLCPDFVLELRSPSDGMRALQAKMEEYRENGAALGWLLDPVSKRV